MKESKVIELTKKLFKQIFPDCSITKVNVSRLHGRGFPDLVVITEYTVFFLEAKAPGKKPTKLQKATLCEFKRAGKGKVRSLWVEGSLKNKKKLIFHDPETDSIDCEICLL